MISASTYQIPPESRINTYTTSDQYAPAIACNGSVYFVAWRSNGQDGSGTGIYGQIYSKNGTAIGNEFLINESTSGSQDSPYVTTDGSNFFVTWDMPLGYSEVYGRVYSSNGTPLSSEKMINPSTYASQWGSNTAYDGTKYLVTYADGVYYFADRHEISGRFVDNAGNPMGTTSFRINTTVTGDQVNPSIATNKSNYLITWTSAPVENAPETSGQDGSYAGIYGRFLYLDGSPKSTEFKINTYTAGNQTTPSVATNGIDYLVAWNSIDANNNGIFAQFINGSDGSFIGSEFQVNQFTMNNQQNANVIFDGLNYFITWESQYQDLSGYGIFGRAIDIYGNFISDEFLINKYTTSDQRIPVAASDGSNYFLTWASSGQDKSGWGVYGTMFSQSTVPEPVSMILLGCSVLGIYLRKKF